jgi:hypothetical protein
MRANSYSKVDAVEQRGVVNSGMRSKKDRDLRTEVDCALSAPIICPIIQYSGTSERTGNL